MDQVEAYIVESDDHQKRLFQLVRGILLIASPKMKEQLAYGVPFYSHYGKICYFNRLKHGIDVGFVRGYELSNASGKLNGEGRSQVKSLRYLTPEDFDEQILMETIQEAILLDEYHNNRKNG